MPMQKRPDAQPRQEMVEQRDPAAEKEVKECSKIRSRCCRVRAPTRRVTTAAREWCQRQQDTFAEPLKTVGGAHHALREREREKQREKEREKPLYSSCCRQGERARATAAAQPVERG